MSKTITRLEHIARLQHPVKCDEHCTLWNHRAECMKASCQPRRECREVESRKARRRKG